MPREIQKTQLSKFHSHRDLRFDFILLARKVGKEGKFLVEEVVSEFIVIEKDWESQIPWTMNYFQFMVQKIILT